MPTDSELTVIDLDSPDDRSIVIDGETGEYRDRNRSALDEPYAGFGGVYTPPFSGEVVIVAIYAYRESLFIQIGDWRGDVLHENLSLKYIKWVPFLRSLRVFIDGSLVAGITIWGDMLADGFSSEAGGMLRYISDHTKTEETAIKSYDHWTWTAAGGHQEPDLEMSDIPTL